MDFIYLSGSEDVKNAAHEMTRAAETMQRASSDFCFQVDRLTQLWQEVSAKLDEETTR